MKKKKKKKTVSQGGILFGLVLILGVIALSVSWNQKPKEIAEKVMVNMPVTEDIQPKSPLVTPSLEPTPSLEVTEKQEFDLFTGNVDSYEKEKSETIKVEKETTLEEKLQSIADHLSKKEFENLPIVIEKIEEWEGKQIAIINLRDDPSQKEGLNWMSFLNGGSTGGTITRVTLEESFLQREYKEAWIDGIKLVYEGEAIPELDHFPGTMIMER